ncbi:hypothetical protein UI24_06825 [Mycobacteroides franklinii]|nr:hypothetical protein [Mycobacteroides franklinii]
MWVLMSNPDSEVMIKSYADDLAEEHSGAARWLISENPGYRDDRQSTAARPGLRSTAQLN